MKKFKPWEAKIPKSKETIGYFITLKGRDKVEKEQIVTWCNENHIKIMDIFISNEKIIWISNNRPYGSLYKYIWDYTFKFKKERDAVICKLFWG